MKREAILKLIKESKPFLATASPAQKLKFLKAIKEGLRRSREASLPEVLVESPKNNDYLPEK
jgi:hypothetical protein